VSQRIRSFPVAPTLLAVALVGFWIYLAALGAVGVPPRTSITGVWYALLGAALVVVVWRRRSTLLRRCRVRLVRFTAGVAVLFFVLYEARAVTSGTHALTVRSALLVALSCIPAAAAALALTSEERETFARAVAALGLAFAVLEFVFLYRGSVGGRYSPLAHLDPISAAQIPAIAFVALLTLRPPDSGRPPLGYLLGIAMLSVDAILPGSRTPVAAGILAVIVVIALSRRYATSIAAATVATAVVSVVLAFAIASMIGTGGHFVADVPVVNHVIHPHASKPAPKGEQPISSEKIRSELIHEALHQARTRLLVGNGVGTLEDNGPEAHRLGLTGCCTFPHDTPVEALYSLGVPGALLYLVFLAGAATLWWLAARSARSPGAFFAVGLVVYAFSAALVDGALSDAFPWLAAALAAAVAADAREPSP
jgi:hypothetical protein